MRIAVLGRGSVGKALGEGWTKAGHEVIYGVRQPREGADEAPVREAAASADVAVLAVPWPSVEDVLAEAGALAGKILVDATNPIKPDFSGLALWGDDSAGEATARMAPEARVVKAFNTIGFNIMENPSFPDGPASLLVAGDEEEAKKTVMALASALGFDPVDAGPLVQSRLLEGMAWLWITMAMKHGHGRDIAFRLMKR